MHFAMRGLQFVQRAVNRRAVAGREDWLHGAGESVEVRFLGAFPGDIAPDAIDRPRRALCDRATA